jgi:chromosome segregation ATPase
MRGSNVMIVVVVAVLGLWGCARGPGSHSSGQAERVRALEGKCVKLEEDYKAVAGARDQARRRVANLEEEHARLQKHLDALQVVVRERDQLRQQMESRTNERDTLQLRCDRLKKGLQNLLGQDDAMLPPAHQEGPVLQANKS